MTHLHIARFAISLARVPMLALVVVVLNCLANSPARAAIELPHLSVWAETTLFDSASEDEDGYTREAWWDGPNSGTLRSDSHALLFPARSANASAYAGYGVLGMSANTTIISQPVSSLQVTSASGSSRAGAVFFDVLHVDVPRLAGQPGTLVVPWKLSGGWGGGLTGPFPRPDQGSEMEWSFRVASGIDSDNGQSALGATHVLGELRADEGRVDASVLSEHQLGNQPFVQDSYAESATMPAIWASIPIIFGMPIGIEARLSISTSAFAGNDFMAPTDPTFLELRSAEAHGNFSHTLRWGGVQQVLDATGKPVAGWVISADSGTDYSVVNTTQLPEPAAWAILLAGLLVLWFQSKKANPA